MQRPGLLGLLLVLSLLALGCPIRWERITLNHQIGAEDVSFIEPGRTTFAQVLSKLGVPDQLKDSEIGPIAQYDFLDVKEFKVDLLSGLPLLLPAVAVVPSSYRQLELEGGRVGSDHFRVFFDSNWIAQGYAFEVHSRPTGYVLWPF